MNTSFTITSAQTVDTNYTWDQGVPILSSLPVYAPVIDENTITGYAPAFKVFFTNTSTADTPSISTARFVNILTTYNWNFNDYYNIDTNVTTTTAANTVTHTYIMPGIYKVSLQQIQTTLQGVVDANTIGNCFGDYSINWFWDNFNSTNTQLIIANTWDNYTSTSNTPKTWDSYANNSCFQKFCKIWQWNALTRNSYSPATWAQTKSRGLYPKLWRYEANDSICQQYIAPQNTSVTVKQELFNYITIQVLEIPPVADMYSLTPILTGVTQLTVQLTPRVCVSGSFPIDRIDWNLGDGTPTKTITRYSPVTDTIFVYTSALSADPSDVRNYDIRYTYTRNNLTTYPVFYPSLTCYSANTNTSDSCCITVGPITLSAAPYNTRLLRARNTDTGVNMYAFNVDNNITFTTTASTTIPTTSQVVPNIPPTTLISPLSSNLLYRGNPGNISIV